jgi:hypothetical protein
MVIRRTSKPARKPAPKRKSENVQRDPTLWADLLAIANRIPEESLKKLPRDGSRNLDHYLYGTPKKDP